MACGRKLLKKRMRTHANIVANMTKSDFQNGGRWLRSVSGPVVAVDEVIEKVKGNSTKGPYTDKCYQSVSYGLV